MSTPNPVLSIPRVISEGPSPAFYHCRGDVLVLYGYSTQLPIHEILLSAGDLNQLGNICTALYGKSRLHWLATMQNHCLTFTYSFESGLQASVKPFQLGQGENFPMCPIDMIPFYTLGLYYGLGPITGHSHSQFDGRITYIAFFQNGLVTYTYVFGVSSKPFPLETMFVEKQDSFVQLNLSQPLFTLPSLLPKPAVTAQGNPPPNPSSRQ